MVEYVVVLTYIQPKLVNTQAWPVFDLRPAFAVRIRFRLAQAYGFGAQPPQLYATVPPPSSWEGQVAPDPFILTVRLYLGLLDATPLREKQARLDTPILTFCGLRGQMLRVRSQCSGW